MNPRVVSFERDHHYTLTRPAHCDGAVDIREANAPNISSFSHLPQRTSPRARRQRRILRLEVRASNERTLRSISGQKAAGQDPRYEGGIHLQTQPGFVNFRDRAQCQHIRRIRLILSARAERFSEADEQELG